MAVQIRPSGPIPAEIMIVGEAPGAEEERQGEPFVGASGIELNRMLHEVGISRSECFITNVCRERPYNNDIGYFIAQTKKDITPEHSRYRGKWVKHQVIEGVELLKKEIQMVKPTMIIALGNTSMWALTGKWGIMKWRGSMLTSDQGIRLVPTYHPAMILRQWEHRAAAVHDLRRAFRYMRQPYPDLGWRFRLRSSLTETLAVLERLRKFADERLAAESSLVPSESLREEEEKKRAAKPGIELSFDLETRNGHIACAGISWTSQDAISIPFMCVENDAGFWSEDEEALIVWHLRRLLRHPAINVVGQNLLYDSQYTYRHWHFVPRSIRDTMISHHTAFAGLPKRLDFQASMYCEQYIYWKDDSKDWDKNLGEEQLWAYNCEDCIRTQECSDAEAKLIKQLHLEEVEAFQQDMFWPVLRAMQLGVRIDKGIRGQMAMELLEEMTKREEYFQAVLGHPLNPRSPKQMMSLFYDDLKLPVQRKRGTGNLTLDEDALMRLATKEPLIKPIVKAILEYRSLGVFLGTFVQAPLDHDERMRCSYNICGTHTYRLSSSKNAFGSGTNLQNLPKGTKAVEPEDLELPNVRKMFIPDPGYVFFDMDLDRADLQVVVWEADDKELKQMLHEGVDIHTENAKLLGCSRQMGKTWVHGTNYGGSPRTMAINCGLTVKQAEDMQKRWFAAHPGIKRWHERTETQLRTRRLVENKYGYRRFFFERVESLLPEALAWIPQSTVAITINKIWHNLYHHLPEVQVLLQVHDSLAGQYPKSFDPRGILRHTQVKIPYEDPLIIPVGIKTSDRSWGHCQ